MPENAVVANDGEISGPTLLPASCWRRLLDSASTKFPLWSIDFSIAGPRMVCKCWNAGCSCDRVPVPWWMCRHCLPLWDVSMHSLGLGHSVLTRAFLRPMRTVRGFQGSCCKMRSKDLFWIWWKFIRRRIVSFLKGEAFFRKYPCHFTTLSVLCVPAEKGNCGVGAVTTWPPVSWIRNS